MVSKRVLVQPEHAGQTGALNPGVPGRKDLARLEGLLMDVIIPFDVKGSERKRLAGEIGVACGRPAIYLKYPTCNYRIGEFLLDKDGRLIIPDTVAGNVIDEVIEHLERVGFHTPQEALERLTIKVPSALLTEAEAERLDAIVDARQELLCSVLAMDEVTVGREGDLVFAWFPYTTKPEEVEAYSLLVERLLVMARTLKRVLAGTNRASNDRYAWRCFLLRLGMVGPEYKSARRVLMRGVEGSSAFATVTS